MSDDDLRQFVEPAVEGDSKAFQKIWGSIRPFMSPGRFCDSSRMSTTDDFEQIARIATWQCLKTFPKSDTIPVVAWCLLCASRAMVREAKRIRDKVKAFPENGFVYPDDQDLTDDSGRPTDGWFLIGEWDDSFSGMEREELFREISRCVKQSFQPRVSVKVISLLRFRLDNPGASWSEAGEETGIDRNSVQYYVRRLRDIVKERTK